MQYKPLLLVLLALVTLLSMGVLAQDTISVTAQVTAAQIRTHPSQGDVVDIEGATATVISNENGIALRFATSNLEENHAYTLWVAMINNPEECSESPCPSPEVLGNSDALQTEMTLGDSLLYSDEALMEFSSFIPAGDVPEGWFGNGLTNPLGAEIHLVVQDHGELIPDMASTMLNTVRGGCTDESVPPPYPEVAKADGEPGPNTCRGMQFAILVQ
jgi:hypothetical protein